MGLDYTEEGLYINCDDCGLVDFLGNEKQIFKTGLKWEKIKHDGNEFHFCSECALEHE